MDQHSGEGESSCSAVGSCRSGGLHSTPFDSREGQRQYSQESSCCCMGSGKVSADTS